MEAIWLDMPKTGSYATGDAAGGYEPTSESTDAFGAVPTAEPTTVLAPYAIVVILVPGACSSPTGYRYSSATGVVCLDAYWLDLCDTKTFLLKTFQNKFHSQTGAAL